MWSSRRASWLSATLALFAVLAFAASASAASPWGEVGERFNGVGTGTEKGHKFLISEISRLFGVDTKENGVFVGDEVSERFEGEAFRIQKYSEKGVWEGEGEIKPPAEAGTSELLTVEGIATDAELGRIYVLTVYERGLLKLDPGIAAAGRIYAFEAEPVSKKLVPAKGTNSEGVLASLEPASETKGKSLLEPHGLTVNQKTHEILILGENDEAKSEPEELRIAIERLSSSGKVEPEYVDPTLSAEEEPEPGPADSPVVSTSGTVYFERPDEIFAANPTTNLHSAPTPVFTLGPNLLKGPFHNELLQLDPAGSEVSGGAGLAIAPKEGEEGGTIFSLAETAEDLEGGELGLNFLYTALAVGYEDGGGAVKAHELGWTGGRESESPKLQCAIPYGGIVDPLVAAGKEGDVFVLAPTEGRGSDSEGVVIRFGPGGSNCPAAKATGTIEASLNGTKVKESELDTTHSFTLSAKIIGENAAASGADVLGTEWSFGDGEHATVTTPAGQETQAAEVLHKFAVGGALTIEATIHSDDLASPPIVVKAVLHVKGTIKSPKAQTVVEPEAATFESSEAGVKASEQWEVSKDEGKSFEAIAGQTSEKLLIESTKTSENGYEYRAKFTIGGEEQMSEAAKLTVLAPSAPAVTASPTSIEVEEGQPASFTAAASGEPPPTVQWEVSTSGGATWAALAGQTGGRLELGHTSTSESGYDYRAVFSNRVSKATSGAATLRVKAKAVIVIPPYMPPATTTTPGGGGVESFQSASPRATVVGTSFSVSSSGAVVLKSPARPARARASARSL